MGNANSGRRERPFFEALQMELKKAGKDSKALRSIASKLIERAEAGEPWAIQEFANRLDGKPVQAIAGDPEQPLHTEIVVRYVRPDGLPGAD